MTRQYAGSIAVAGPARVDGIPRYDECVVSEHSHIRAVLAGRRQVVDDNFRAVRCPVGIKQLRNDPKATAILYVGSPGDDPPAIGKRVDTRIVLILDRCRVDLEFVAGTRRKAGAVACQLVAVDVKALAEDALSVAVRTKAFPDNDKVAARARQGHDGRIVFVPGISRVDHLFAAYRLRRIRGRGDRDRDNLRLRRAAVAVRDLDSQIACRQRIVRNVAIGQVFDQQLHDLGCRVRIQAQFERRAVLPVLDDLPDRCAGH